MTTISQKGCCLQQHPFGNYEYKDPFIHHNMTSNKAHRLKYERPCSESFEVAPQGVLCQSSPDMQTQSLETPSAPTATDHAW